MNRSIVILSSLTMLAGSAACHRSATADAIDAEAAHRADSAATLVAERNRSTATQAEMFSDEERLRFNRVELMIQAKFPGVKVIPRGRNYAIQIRGTNSISASNDPHVVIDGVPRTVGDLATVDPKDVTKIEVLKDGAAAFYGTRGANGVIIITTRRAR
jgi:TonB-dependent SusC/RagA subfamily outer membrane receptor